MISPFLQVGSEVGIVTNRRNMYTRTPFKYCRNNQICRLIFNVPSNEVHVYIFRRFVTDLIWEPTSELQKRSFLWWTGMQQCFLYARRFQSIPKDERRNVMFRPLMFCFLCPYLRFIRYSDGTARISTIVLAEIEAIFDDLWRWNRW